MAQCRIIFINSGRFKRTKKEEISYTNLRFIIVLNLLDSKLGQEFGVHSW